VRCSLPAVVQSVHPALTIARGDHPERGQAQQATDNCAVLTLRRLLTQVCRGVTQPRDADRLPHAASSQVMRRGSDRNGSRSGRGCIPYKSGPGAVYITLHGVQTRRTVVRRLIPTVRRQRPRRETVAQAIVLREPCGSTALRIEEISVGAPAAGELRVQQHAIGVNFHDI
jgi:hypothetical protein